MMSILSKTRRKAASLSYRISGSIQNFFSHVHPAPVFLLGNQKTGSTAISALLARAAGLDVTLDIFYRIPGPAEKMLLEGQLSFQQFIRNNKRFFSNPLIKEPGLSFWMEDLITLFPKSPLVFFLRDPRENIRSILNRLHLPGNLPELTDEQFHSLPNDIWKMILDGTLYGTKGPNYIQTQALRWLRIVELYERRADQIILLRYEDFLQDKVGCIEQLAAELNLPVVSDIRPHVNTQYQSRGNRSIAPIDFFGMENLSQIEKICGEKMERYNYHRSDFGQAMNEQS